MSIIVVSLPCTAYLWGALIALCEAVAGWRFFNRVISNLSQSCIICMGVLIAVERNNFFGKIRKKFICGHVYTGVVIDTIISC